MPASWYRDRRRKRRSRVDPPRAEEVTSDPFDDDDGTVDDLRSFDYREKDRDSMFDGLMQRLDLVAVMITVIIAGAVGYVGINIMDNTVDTAGLSFNETDTSQNDGFQNATMDLTDGLESFFSNLGTVFVVIVLVVIIGYLMLLRGR